MERFNSFQDITVGQLLKDLRFLHLFKGNMGCDGIQKTLFKGCAVNIPCD